MIDVLLTDENLILLGLLFGLIMISPLIIDVIQQSIKPDSQKDDEQ